MVHILTQFFGVFLYYGQVRNNRSWYTYPCHTYCCYTTGIWTRMCNTAQNSRRKLHGFGVQKELAWLLDGWSKYTPEYFISFWRVGIDWISVHGSEWTWFCLVVEKDFV